MSLRYSPPCESGTALLGPGAPLCSQDGQYRFTVCPPHPMSSRHDLTPLRTLRWACAVSQVPASCPRPGPKAVGLAAGATLSLPEAAPPPGPTLSQDPARHLSSVFMGCLNRAPTAEPEAPRLRILALPPSSQACSGQYLSPPSQRTPWEREIRSPPARLHRTDRRVESDPPCGSLANVRHRTAAS